MVRGSSVSRTSHMLQSQTRRYELTLADQLRDAQSSEDPPAGSPPKVKEEYRRRDDLESLTDAPNRELRNPNRSTPRRLLHSIQEILKRLGGRSIPASVLGRASSNPFEVIISIELPHHLRGTGLRSARLLLDTGSDYSIIGLQLAKLICPEHDYNSPSVQLARTEGGGSIHSLGTISARWCIDSAPSSAVHFPKRFMLSDFHVSAQELQYDAYLGWQDICDLQLLRPGWRLGFVNGFKSPAPLVDSAYIVRSFPYSTDNELEKKAAQVEADAAKRRQDQESQRRSDPQPSPQEQLRAARAHEQAMANAQAHADQHRRLYGDADFLQVYHAQYMHVYPIYYAQYPS